MNDKMTELYASACLYARDKQLDRKPEDKDVCEFVKCMSERFAELIIKECAMFSMVITDDHFDVDALYKHFGVE